MRVRRRLLLIMTAAGLVGAVLVASGAIALLRGAVRERFVERIAAETALLGAWAAELSSGDDFQAFAEQAARRLGVRVSLISSDGTVVGDSSRERARLSAMNNHYDRPEIRDARLRGTGDPPCQRRWLLQDETVDLVAPRC